MAGDASGTAAGLVRGTRRRCPAAADRIASAARSRPRATLRAAGQLDDLTQVGAVGLIKAVDRYDPARGSSFTAYAVPTILGEIRRHLRDAAQPVRAPRRQGEGGSSSAPCRSRGRRRPRDAVAERRTRARGGAGPDRAGPARAAEAPAQNCPTPLLRERQPAWYRHPARPLAGSRLAAPARLARKVAPGDRPDLSVAGDIRLPESCADPVHDPRIRR